RAADAVEKWQRGPVRRGGDVLVSNSELAAQGTVLAGKRLLDLALAAVLIVLLLPVFVTIALAILLVAGRPVLFRQARRGKDGFVFQIVKFRTMDVGAEARRHDVDHLNGAEWPLFKVKVGDPRVTAAGRVLRRWSLDELPQLWNVLTGEMSLVGPRPLVV